MPARCAGVARKNARAATVGSERAYRRFRLPLAVVDMVDLGDSGLHAAVERKGDPSEGREELLVRRPCDEQLAVHECEVGDGALTERPAIDVQGQRVVHHELLAPGVAVRSDASVAALA